MCGQSSMLQLLWMHAGGPHSCCSRQNCCSACALPGQPAARQGAAVAPRQRRAPPQGCQQRGAPSPSPAPEVDRPGGLGRPRCWRLTQPAWPPYLALARYCSVALLPKLTSGPLPAPRSALARTMEATVRTSSFTSSMGLPGTTVLYR